MKPITFSCKATLNNDPTVIANQILDVENWSQFTGYGLLPGIARAKFERRTPEVIGSRIRVQNTDGSSHVEEIVEWQPDRRIRIRLTEFSAPLCHLATEFHETWDFEQQGDATRVIRSFSLLAKLWWTRPVLVVISWLLKRAVARHLRQLRTSVLGESPK